MGKKHKKKNFTIPDKPIVEIEEKELTENKTEKQEEVLQDEVLFECEDNNTEVPVAEIEEETVETESTDTEETISESEPTEELEVKEEYDSDPGSLLADVEIEKDPLFENIETEEPAAEGQSESDPFRKTEIDNDGIAKSNDSLGENKQESSEGNEENSKPKHKARRTKKRSDPTMEDDRREPSEQEPVGEQPITGYVIRIGMRYFVSGNPGRYITTEDILGAKKYTPETKKAAELLAMSINGTVDCVHF